MFSSNQSKAKTWTVDDVVEEELWGKNSKDICERLWNGRKHLSLKEIIKLDITPEDVMYFALRMNALNDNQIALLIDKIMRRANDTADRAVRIHCANCGIEVVEQWADKWLTLIDRSESSLDKTYGAVQSLHDADSVIMAIASCQTFVAALIDTLSLNNRSPWYIASLCMTVVKAAAKADAYAADVEWVGGLFEAYIDGIEHASYDAEFRMQIRDLIEVMGDTE